jgi:hypothetical protein
MQRVKDRRVHGRRLLLAAAALAVTAGAPSAARAQSLTISDGQFDNADWTYEVTANTGAGWQTSPEQQYPDGGNPGTFRGGQWSVAAGGVDSYVGMLSLYTAKAYNPAVDGPVRQVDFKLDALITDAPGGTSSRVIGLSPALQQGDTLYLGNVTVPSNPAWTTFSWASLEPGAFTRIRGTGPARPNFTAAGAPIHFGYFNDLRFDGTYQAFHGIDNWSVALTNVPPTAEPYVVNVDLGDTRAYSTGAGGLPAPGTHWNVLNGSTLTAGSLQDSATNATTVGFRWTPYVDFQTLRPLQVVSDYQSGDRPELIADGAFNGIDSDVTPDKFGGEMSITGLVPNGHYNAALYGYAYGSGGDRTHLTKFTVNGATQTTSGPMDAEGGNYVVFRDLIADANGDLLVKVHNAGPNGGYWIVNGFQIENLALANPTWTAGAGGAWGGTANWSAAVPDAPGAVAVFGPAAAPVTVNVDAARTVGTIGFDSPQSYKLAGDAITLNGSGYDGLINVSRGSHEIAAPVNVTGAGQIVVAAGAKLKLSGRLTGKLSRLAVADGATLDLVANPVVLDYFGHNPAAELAAAIAAGARNGVGLTTSLAADPANNRAIAIGLIDNATLGWTTFLGVDIDATTLLVRPTWYGDANLDGLVNATDLGLLNAGAAGGLTGWYNGDFDGDGAVTADDFALFNLGNAMQRPLTPAVPEPATAATLSLIAGAWTLRGRPRRRAL